MDAPRPPKPSPAAWAPPPAWQPGPPAEHGTRPPAWEDPDRDLPPGRTSGRLAIAGLALSAATSLLLIALILPLLDPETWLLGFDGDRIDALSSLAGLADLVIAVAYLAWSWTVTGSYQRLTGVRPRVGRVGAVGWWFVPLANVVMPAYTLSGLVVGLSIPGRPRSLWLVPVWWVAYLLSLGFSSLWSIRIADLTASASDDELAYASATNLLIAGEGFSVVAAVTLIVILLRIARASALRQRVLGGSLPWPLPPDAR